MKKIFVLFISIFLSACNSRLQATEMKLKKTEGTASVKNESSQDQPVRENMNLYNGYQVDTKQESYAWIDLDAVKLLKMDQNSEIHLENEDKHLKVQLDEGELFFCVSEKLNEDESLEFVVPNQTNMSMSVRGTTGIIKNLSDNVTHISLIEGEMEIHAKDQIVTLHTGETMQAVVNEKGELHIEVRELAYGGDVSDYVIDEINRNDTIKNKIAENNGNTEYLNQEEKKEVLMRLHGTWEWYNGDTNIVGIYRDESVAMNYYKIDMQNLTISTDDTADFNGEADFSDERGVPHPIPLLRLPDESTFYVMDENRIVLNRSFEYTLSDNDMVLSIHNLHDGRTSEYRRISE